MIKYLGSKRTLVPRLTEVIHGLDGVRSVVDLFSGTSRVGHALKDSGLLVRSNDLNRYAATIARCYVQADRQRWLEPAEEWLRRLQSLPGTPGYFTQTFCEEARFFMPENGQRVDAIRQEIHKAALDEELEAILLVSLMEAADRVDSTTGVQMAYLKQWAKRAHKTLELRMPSLLDPSPHGPGEAHCMDALEAARTLTGDVAYLDPPYNQHKYLGNYHIWETLVRWDAPEAYGVARKRLDVRQRKSPFNSKRGIHEAMRTLVDTLDTRHLVVSFSNEGHITHDEMVQILAKRGPVFVLTHDYKRYVGAKIGIHNPSGKKVGQVSHVRNKEFVFIVPERAESLKLPQGSVQPTAVRAVH